MATTPKRRPENVEFHRLMCERLGVNPANALSAWHAQYDGGDTVAVTITSYLRIPKAEYYAMQIQAEATAAS